MSHSKNLIKSIINSALWLPVFLFTKIKEFNDLSPPLNSRMPTIVALFILKRYLLNNLVLFKSPNPNSVNTARDLPNIVNIKYNVGKKTLFASDPKVLQTDTHWLGQDGRFICRAGFQAPAIFYNQSNAASVSKASNLVCEVIAVAATDISIKSQLEGKILFYNFLPLPDLQYYESMRSKGVKDLPETYELYDGVKYIKENTGIKYYLDTFATASFRAFILYGIGEFIIAPFKKIVIEPLINHLERNSVPALNYIAGTPENFINFEDDPYTAYNKITTNTNHSIAGYSAFILLEIQHLIEFSTVEAIVGNIMISSSRVVTPILMEITNKYSSLAVTALDSIFIAFVYNDEKIFNYLFNGFEASIDFAREQLNYIAYETIEETILGDVREL